MAKGPTVAQMTLYSLVDQPKASPLEWLGYYHNTDATVLPPNCLTFPSINCFIPQRDKIVPRTGKTLLGQAFTTGKNLPIIGHKERFTTMGGDTVEVRVTEGDIGSNQDTIEVLYNNPLTQIPTWYPLSFGTQNYLNGIGANYGGGKIAYILKPGDPGYDPALLKGLIVSSVDLSAGIYWHATGTGTTGATGTVLGTGLTNTNAIIYAYGAESNAALLCKNYAGGGFTDWYLPSKDELNKVYLNAALFGSFTADTLYWSSTELTSATAWGQVINSSGAQISAPKASTQPVRAMRSFSLPNGINNFHSKGLHRYYMDDWFDTNINPALSLNVPRLIWTNGNPAIYSWIGAIGPIVYSASGNITIDFSTITYNTLTGVFVDGETIIGGTSGAIGFYYAPASSTGILKLQGSTPGTGGPYTFGETITGATSGATAKVLSYLVAKTWASIGFIDPAVTGDPYGNKITINGHEYTIVSGYNTPILLLNSNSPAIIIGDVAFSEIRSNSVPIPLDVCRNNKNYMFYGNWNSRRLFMSNNFNRPAIETITGISDYLTLPAFPDFTGSTPMTFNVIIDGGDGTIDHFAWSYIYNFHSYLGGDNITITPGYKQTLTTPYGSIGIIFNTDSDTLLSIGNGWIINVYPAIGDFQFLGDNSTPPAWANFNYSLPVRKPGEGYIYQLTSNFWAMEPQEESMYVNTKYGTWSYISTVLSADLQSESVSLTPLKQSSISKVIYPYMISHLDNDLIFVTENKTLDMIGRQQYIELPQIGYLSQPVDIDFKNATFEDGSIQYWDKKLFITSPKELAMFCFDNQAGNKYWQPPQVYSENGILSLVNNTLISHSNIRNQTFQLYTGESDDGAAYTVRARTPYHSYGNRWGKKNSNKSFFEGYVSGAPKMKFTVYQGVKGCGGIFSHTVQPIICVAPTRAPLGEGNLGSHPFGSDMYENDLSHFNEIYTKFNPILEYYFAALEAECTSTNHTYIWLSMALNEVPSNRNNLELITEEVISRE